MTSEFTPKELIVIGTHEPSCTLLLFIETFICIVFLRCVAACSLNDGTFSPNTEFRGSNEKVFDFHGEREFLRSNKTTTSLLNKNVFMSVV